MSDYIVHKAIEISNLSKKAAASIEDHEYILSPKYDGCHVVFCFDGGEFVAAFSRTGEFVVSMPHIAEALPHHYNLSKGRIAICGEAWSPGHEFSELSGWFRRQYPEPRLGFVPFDVVPFDPCHVYGTPVALGVTRGVPCQTPYRERIKFLQERTTGPTLLHFPFTHECRVGEVQEKATALAKHYKAHGGYDGVVAARADGKYTVGAGRGGEFLKFKPLLSETVTVTAVISDIGPKTGKNTCVFTFELHGATQKVSTGLTQDQANEYTLHPEDIIGQRIEVEAMGITVNGLLREPRFKGIRHDA